MSYSEIEKIILQDDTRGMATLYENIEKGYIETVSYTHLTLPTICSV